VLRYETHQTGIDNGDTYACLSGQTTAGLVIQATMNVEQRTLSFARAM